MPPVNTATRLQQLQNQVTSLEAILQTLPHTQHFVYSFEGTLARARYLASTPCDTRTQNTLTNCVQSMKTAIAQAEKFRHTLAKSFSEKN